MRDVKCSTYHRFRLVVEDLVNLLENFRCQLRDHVDSLQVVDDWPRYPLKRRAKQRAGIRTLLWLRRTQDNRARIRVLRDPRQRELRDRAPKLILSKLRERPDFVDLRLAVVLAEAVYGVLEELGVRGEARALWDPVVVLACEQARGERGPDGRPNLVLGVDGAVKWSRERYGWVEIRR